MSRIFGRKHCHWSGERNRQRRIVLEARRDRAASLATAYASVLQRAAVS
jgi:hypothetical protein